MRQILAIFQNTFTETIRQPIYGLLLISTAIVLLLIPLSASHIYTLSVGTLLENAPERMNAELGLSTILLAGLLFAVFSASGVINREVEQKTALTVLSKSVSRGGFILGKFLGVASAVTIAILSLSMLLMMIVRFGSNEAAYKPLDWLSLCATFFAIFLAVAIATFKNYFQGKSWVGSFAISFFLSLLFSFSVVFFFDKDYSIAITETKFGSYDWQLAIAALLTAEAVLLLCAIAVAASTRLGAAANFFISAIFFCGGLTGEYFYGNYQNFKIIKVLYSLMPNLQTFWMSEALKREINIPLSYAVDASLYCILYTAGIVFAAAYLFNRREIS